MRSGLGVAHRAAVGARHGVPWSFYVCRRRPRQNATRGSAPVAAPEVPEIRSPRDSWGRGLFVVPTTRCWAKPGSNSSAAGPAAVANPGIGAPPIQDWIQFPDHHIDPPVRRKRPCCFAYPLADVAARLFTWPQVQQPPRSLPELETEEPEARLKRRQPTLLLFTTN